MIDALTFLKKHNTSVGIEKNLTTFDIFNQLVDYDNFNKLEQKFSKK